ncbi:cytochrome bd-type quinol oxidase subunit 2 [Xanthomonas translucens]
MSRPHETQELYTRDTEAAARSRAHRGSPWAWILVVALVLAAGGWWLSRDRGDEASANSPAPATPANDPPRAP